MIALDIGNSRVKFGLFRESPGNSQSELPVCTKYLAAPLDRGHLPWDQLSQLFQRDASPVGHVPQFVASSVNPRELARILSEWPIELWPLPVVIPSAGLPIANLTRYPEKVGTDRLLKAIAANLIRMPDQPIIVVDSGTATTVDWITARGEFLGGAILPGLELASKALHEYTAQLPLIDTRELSSVPQAIGQDTVGALQSGLFWGHVGAVHELTQRMAREQGNQPPEILVTGGAGKLLAEQLDRATYRPTLTLEGLVIAARSHA